MPVYRDLRRARRWTSRRRGSIRRSVRSEIQALAGGAGRSTRSSSSSTSRTRSGRSRGRATTARRSTIPSMHDDPDDAYVVRVDGGPGPEDAIEKVAFQGNDSVPDKTLLGLMLDPQAGLPAHFARPPRGRRCSPRTSSAILGYYQRHGWVGAKVDPPRVDRRLEAGPSRRDGRRSRRGLARSSRSPRRSTEPTTRRRPSSRSCSLSRRGALQPRARAGGRRRTSSLVPRPRLARGRRARRAEALRGRRRADGRLPRRRGDAVLLRQDDHPGQHANARRRASGAWSHGRRAAVLGVRAARHAAQPLARRRLPPRGRAAAAGGPRDAGPQRGDRGPGGRPSRSSTASATSTRPTPRPYANDPFVVGGVSYNNLFGRMISAGIEGAVRSDLGPRPAPAAPSGSRTSSIGDPLTSSFFARASRSRTSTSTGSAWSTSLANT